MKRRFLSVILAAYFTVCCFSFPALGEENSGFTDVSPDDWFAPYVEVCVEEGLMQGTGDGRFEPLRELTLAETVVLAARFYAKSQGLEEIPPCEIPENLDEDTRQALDLLYQSPNSFWYANAFLYLGFEPGEILSLTDNGYHSFPPPDFSWFEQEPCFRGDFAELLGEMTPSPIATRLPKDIMEIDNSGAQILIATGVLEGTGEGYALDKSLTRAEAATMLARMMRPALRKTDPVEKRSPEELVALEVQHGSFGRIESKYTLDLSENSLTAWYSGYFQDAEDREETVALTGEAVETFRQSPAAESLLGWGNVYYNMAVMDGHQWKITLTFSDGSSREIFGSNAYPQEWELVYEALNVLTGKEILDTHSYAMTWFG